MSTELVERPPDGAINLFGPASPDAAIEIASHVATRFADIVKQQKLFQTIGGRQHVLIEGWQTVGSMVGCYAIDDGRGVRELPWPTQLVETFSDEPKPPLAGAYGRGLAFGFVAGFHARNRAGDVVGWGEGRCTRTEKGRADVDDYSLSSMAQTRGQSRTLAAPLKWIVKLAGYNTTPAEEISASDEPEALDDAQLRELMGALQQTWPGLDAYRFLEVLARRLGNSIPESVGTALRAWAWWASRDEASGSESAQNAGDAARDAETTGEGQS